MKLYLKTDHRTNLDYERIVQDKFKGTVKIDVPYFYKLKLYDPFTRKYIKQKVIMKNIKYDSILDVMAAEVLILKGE